MHRHWPVVRSSHSRFRSVATATKAKVRSADTTIPYERQKLRASSHPSLLHVGFSSLDGQQAETNSQPSSSRAPEPLGAPPRTPIHDLNKWTRSSPPNPSPSPVKPKTPTFPSLFEQQKQLKSKPPRAAKWAPGAHQKSSPDDIHLLSSSRPPRQFGLKTNGTLDDLRRSNGFGTPRRQSSPPRETSSVLPPKGALVTPSSETLAAVTERYDDVYSTRDERYERHVRTTHNERGLYKARGSLLAKPYRGKDNQPVVAKPKAKVKNMTKGFDKKFIADVYIPSTLSVGTLSRLLGVRLEALQRKMRSVGMAEEAKYNHVLTCDYAALLAEEFGRKPVINDEAAFDIYPPPPCSDFSMLRHRPPVVTIMGHVDHGKTTLLDKLRSSSVAQGEAGGITQHIGAFSVPVQASSGASDLQSITFLDTPGHAAFSAMRARGAGVTDIVVLVVAADDGIMPQTKEVINLVKREGGKTGVVVAINKVDKPEADIDAVQKALLAENVHLEALGGEIPAVEVSGLTGHGLPALIETLSAMAEMQELRAEYEGPIQGYILESKVMKGLGPVATVLVLRGCLKPGVHLISGLSYAKIRIISDPTSTSLKAAYPGMAVTVSGWKTLPNAGDEVLQGSEAEVKKALTNRQRKAEVEATLVDIEAINSARRQDRERRDSELQLENAEESLKDVEQGPKELRLIIKGDVSGSAEAVKGALEGIGNDKAIARIISSGVGDISESDVMTAKALGGTIVGFSVTTPKAIETLAARNEVPIISSNIIYRLMEIVQDRVISLLPVVIETRVVGEAAVLRIFEIHVKGKQTKKVAGCRVTNGLVEKSKFARLVRSGTIIHEGTLDTMRVLKKDVNEIRKGSECGLCFGASFCDIREGDLIQMYEKIEKPGSL